MAYSPSYTSSHQPAPPHQPVPPHQPGPQPISRYPGKSKRPHAHSPKSSQPPVVWLLSTIVLSALAIAPKDLWPRFSVSLSPQSTRQESLQPWSINSAAPARTCQAMVNGDQHLSRAQLTQFLSVAQATPQTTVHETIAPPYCTLSKASQPKQSEAYPLAFDPDTWFVVNYDQGVYTGYDFIFQQ